MPTIAIVFGVRIIIYPKDHLPPHREQVAYIWREIRFLRYQGGMIEE
jgi:hypothetical protein